MALTKYIIKQYTNWNGKGEKGWNFYSSNGLRILHLILLNQMEKQKFMNKI